MKNMNVTRLLLLGGVISAPLFFIIAIVQVITRTEFDIKRHAISTLTLGDLGWIQSANFIVTGLLAVLAAIGARGLLMRGTGRAGLWLIGVYGIGMIMAGLFKPDPGLGFPSGAPEGMPTSMSGHAALHSMAFFASFICLIAAMVVFSRRFRVQGERGWRVYCLSASILAPLLIVAGMGINIWVGIIMGVAGMVAFGWVSALAARLLKEAY
ncbi:DUF998 domain-containing protein [Cohnella nanjingensis]|uniref:DUF998 domain-containing protein n=1 Tax=Cohnella nanjingensis TaxID=1387779 RepID=A0A7X0RTB8_9BACL|nr:DUF998 domain-containing protein [Cohnella nanjingensis]MBB6671824.1 DUF998 domain-containing protein [Cohnella nanjingensis]